MWAAPPAILVGVAVILAAIDPAALALNLLAPAVALAVIGLIAAHGIWRVAAILIGRRRAAGASTAARAATTR